MTISAVVLTKNNQNIISKLLRQLSWCDEVLIIDDDSADRTRILAKGLGARVFRHPLGHNFAAQRNFGLKQIKTDWVLFIDADEAVSPALTREIKSALKSDLNGFYIKRTDYFLGSKLRFGETGYIKLLRLAKTNLGIWRRPVHEVWQVKPPIGELKSPLYHYPHQTISTFLTKINYYTDIEAKHRHSFSLLEIFIYPPAKFIHNYILKLGFLDGMPGFVMALLMSLHSLLVRLKLYEKTFLRSAPHPNRR